MDNLRKLVSETDSFLGELFGIHPPKLTHIRRDFLRDGPGGKGYFQLGTVSIGDLHGDGRGVLDLRCRWNVSTPKT